MDALFLYLTCFLVAVIGAGLTAGGLLWRFSRRCTSLEWAVGDIQGRLSSFKGKELAEKRWQKRDQLDMAMEDALKTPGVPLSTGPRRRYDNDPLGD